MNTAVILVLLLAVSTLVVSKKDFYEVLGVNRKATTQQIKRAYRRLAVKYHPDKNKGKDAEEKWLEISQAYEILSDKEKRQRYDQFGEDGVKEGGFGGGGGAHSFNGDGFSFHFDDFFGGSPFSDSPFHEHSFFDSPFGSSPFKNEHSHFSFDHSDHHHHHEGFGDESMMFEDDGFHSFGMDDDFEPFGGMFGGGHGDGSNGDGSQRCRVVTQRTGNMVVTQTICD